MTTTPQSNSEPGIAGCPWCNAVPQPHPDVLSAKDYMVLYHTATCYRTPQLGGYELIPINKIDKWGSRVSASTAPRHYFCSCGGALSAEEYITHYFELGHDRGVNTPSRFCESFIPASTAPVVDETPLCPVHQQLEDAGTLECDIGNNCVACSLNELSELLEMIAPFAAEGNTEDSVTALRRIVEFYKTHAGENRVVVSYPAASPEVQVIPDDNEVNKCK